MIFNRNEKPFMNFENAAKSIPRSKGPLKILVFNKQGLPILQYAQDDGATNRIDERDSAVGADLVRDIFRSMNEFQGTNPERVAFFYKNEVITLESDDPFVFLVTWPKNAFKVVSGASESYIKRLGRTLHEELT